MVVLQHHYRLSKLKSDLIVFKTTGTKWIKFSLFSGLSIKRCAPTIVCVTQLRVPLLDGHSSPVKVSIHTWLGQISESVLF